MSSSFSSSLPSSAEFVDAVDDVAITHSAAALRQSVIASYDEHYSDLGQLRDTDSFYRWIVEMLLQEVGWVQKGHKNILAGRRLLDIACGEGILVKFAKEYGLSGYGADFSPGAIALARRNLPSGHFSTADGERLPYADESFDFITNIGSLEHFFSPTQGLREMRRVLRADGYVGLVLPNSYYLLDILWHVWRTGMPVSHSQIIERFATVGQWTQLIEENGLHVVQTYKYNFIFPRTPADWRWFLRYPAKFAYTLLSPLTPLNLSYQFLFICRKG